MSVSSSAIKPWAVACYGNNCGCDWRLTMTGCTEAGALRSINYCVLVVSLLVAAAELALLAYRIFRKGQTLLSTRTSDSGFFRPKPIETYLLLTAAFNLLRGLYTALLLADAMPNMTVQEGLFDFAWYFGYNGIVLYLIGIIYTIPRNHNIRISSSRVRMWVPSQKLVDMFAFYQLVGPVFTVLPCTLLTGYFADRSMHKEASIMVSLHYALWSFFTLSLTCGLAYFGNQLRHILSAHINNIREQLGGGTNDRVRMLEKALRGFMLTMATTIVIVVFFIIALSGYAAFRNWIHSVTPFSLLDGVLWLLITPVMVGCSTLMIAMSSSRSPANSSHPSSNGSKGSQSRSGMSQHTNASVPASPGLSRWTKSTDALVGGNMHAPVGTTSKQQTGVVMVSVTTTTRSIEDVCTDDDMVSAEEYA